MPIGACSNAAPEPFLSFPELRLCPPALGDVPTLMTSPCTAGC